MSQLTTGVNVKGGKSLDIALAGLRKQNKDEPHSRSYEEIFREVLKNDSLFKQLKKYVQNALKTPKRKNDTLAVEKRDKGVSCYYRRKFKKALQFYNDSLTFASSELELAQTYCYRGAVYFGLELYESCMKDLKRATSLKYPKKTKYVLFYNLSCCHFLLNEFEEAHREAEEGIKWLKVLKDKLTKDYMLSLFELIKYKSKINIKLVLRKKLTDQLNVTDQVEELNLDSNAGTSESKETEKPVSEERRENVDFENLNLDYSAFLSNESRKRYFEGMVTDLERDTFDDFEVLGADFSSTISETSIRTPDSKAYKEFSRDLSDVLSFSRDVEPIYSKKTGNRLETMAEFGTGDIVSVDTPLAACLLLGEPKNRHYCAYCFQRADILMVPCSYCSEVRFCSEECRISAWKEFHYVECGYLGFLLETDFTGYLVMRILLKVGVEYLARLPLEDLKEVKILRINSSDPVKVYNFFYRLPLEEVTASDKIEAALGSVILLHFLDKMYTKISKVEGASLKVEDATPTISFDKAIHASEQEQEILGIRMVRHWLQIYSGHYTLEYNKLYIPNTKDEVSLANREYPALCVFPHMGLFRHSCDPNVENQRFEGGPVIFRAARKIPEGEILTVSRGVNCYKDDYHERKLYLFEMGLECDCKPCVIESLIDDPISDVDEQASVNSNENDSEQLTESSNLKELEQIPESSEATLSLETKGLEPVFESSEETSPNSETMELVSKSSERKEFESISESYEVNRLDPFSESSEAKELRKQISLKLKYFENKLKQARELISDEKFEQGLNIIVGIVRKERDVTKQGTRIFWKMHEEIDNGLKEEVKYVFRLTKQQRDNFSAAAHVIAVANTAIESMFEINFLESSLLEVSYAGVISVSYVKSLRKLSVVVPNVFKMEVVRETLEKLLKLVTFLKNVYLRCSFRTHYEVSTAAVLNSGERCLVALMRQFATS